MYNGIMSGEGRYKKLFGSASWRTTTGFTLIEMLVSFGVIAIVTGVTLLNFHSSNEALALDRTANKMAQDIRRSAELALQSEQTTSCGGSISAYGVYMQVGTPNSYAIYANCDGIDKAGYSNTQDDIIETIALEDAVIISAIDTPTNYLAVAFFPPDPTVALCKNDSCPTSESSATITLALKNNPTQTKIIIINAAGFVDVN
jgi:type II secretory pathway pseudopilin PulG